ncbi:hypothetical protein C347_00065 [Cryptococcus neoformans AD2-60a]|nr:hypothetical protein C353_06794 [Cryptococcus neoformans var. grubii AD1-83a]OWZ37375.1 hypothetical protein C347_00065 [Cryptococcus neoformans var. grubii AD2-60a]OXC81118.1 hypothetical protein C344_06654 [Cryptococcus neoformans var. grubii AD1-7a]OXG43721.1 hypothetical protein C354_06773 [Cryptococcus neoformans var. grubii MW-RSA1955]OXG47853.1 hypothetical protein C352_06793 [Cryptococcus neoformans var. grubii CHC193]OXG56436.1 hypothetical protein C351_06771 [Cryptococcus neoforma
MASISTAQKPSCEWPESIATFEGLFNRYSSSRHPFSIFNISLFRWTPSLPSSAMLEPLLTLASNILQPEQQPTIKALIGLQTYTTQLRDAVRVKQLDTGDKEVQGRLDKLVKSYAASGNVIARILWEADGNEGKMSSHDLHVALKQSIGSFFAVRSLLETSSAIRYDTHILGSIYPSVPPYHQSFLSPILEHCRRTITSLKANPSRPLAHSKLPSAAPQLSRGLTDTEVTCLLGYLQTINEGLSNIGKIDSLNSTPLMGRMAKAKEKHMKQENEHRLLRVRMEVMSLMCDLLLSMTNKRMSEVKARAARRLSREESEEAAEEKVESEASNRSKSRGKSRSKSIDSMPDTNTNNCVSLCAATSTFSSSDTPISFIEWEVLAEKSLINCFDFATYSAKNDRITVLTNSINHSDWLGVASPQLKPGMKSKSQSPSPSHPCPSSSNMSDDEDFDLDSSTSFISEDENDEDEGSSYRCPLRTLFALHDRYEEQRLAIWLTLPTPKRGKMTAFMRGGKDEEVGRAWDGLGMSVMSVIGRYVHYLSFQLSFFRLSSLIRGFSIVINAACIVAFIPWELS